MLPVWLCCLLALVGCLCGRLAVAASLLPGGDSGWLCSGSCFVGLVGDHFLGSSFGWLLLPAFLAACSLLALPAANGACCAGLFASRFLPWCLPACLALAVACLLAACCLVTGLAASAVGLAWRAAWSTLACSHLLPFLLPSALLLGLLHVRRGLASWLAARFLHWLAACLALACSCPLSFLLPAA